MSGRVKEWICPECHHIEYANEIGVPEMPIEFECNQCLIDRGIWREMKIKEDTFNYKRRDCPWCDAGLVMPEFAIEEGLENGDTYPCPECGELCAFTGEWEEVEGGLNYENWEVKGEIENE